MPSVLPDGEPAPPDGSLPAVGARRHREATVRVLRARAVLRGAVRLLRLQHLHRLRARLTCPAPPGRRTPTRRSPRCGSPGRSSATRTSPVETVFFGGRHADAAAARRPGPDARRDRRRVRAGAGRRGDDRVEPGQRRRRRPRPAARRRVQPDLVRHAVVGAHVLPVLDRTHDPERVPQAVRWAREAGFEQVSLDLIYGTPGESLDDWRRSLDAALACGPDHVSAYALIVEDGTALARQIRRGDVPMTDDDDLADKYLLADEALAGAGLGWYEVSNWARDPRRPAGTTSLYWSGGDWWGVGPGAHAPRGRCAVVERQAPDAVRRADRPGRQPGPRARGARRGDPSRRARAAGDPAAPRGSRSTCSTTPAVPPCPSRSSEASSRRPGWLRAGCC